MLEILCCLRREQCCALRSDGQLHASQLLNFSVVIQICKGSMGHLHDDVAARNGNNFVNVLCFSVPEQLPSTWQLP